MASKLPPSGGGRTLGHSWKDCNMPTTLIRTQDIYPTDARAQNPHVSDKPPSCNNGFSQTAHMHMVSPKEGTRVYKAFLGVAKEELSGPQPKPNSLTHSSELETPIGPLHSVPS